MRRAQSFTTSPFISASKDLAGRKAILQLGLGVEVEREGLRQERGHLVARDAVSGQLVPPAAAGREAAGGQLVDPARVGVAAGHVSKDRSGAGGRNER